jgi:primary-amine oxidase
VRSKAVAADPVPHPLDPLSAEEVAEATRVLRAARGLGGDAIFSYVSLAEPPKHEVLRHAPGDPLERRAHILLRSRSERRTYEAVVSLTTGEVISWKHRPDAQTPQSAEDFNTVNEVLKAHPDFQEAMRRRGVTDLDLVLVEPWPIGYTGPEDAPSRRLSRPLAFVATDERDNEYAHPVEGVISYVDLDTREVLRVEDHGVVPLPANAGNYSADRLSDEDNVPRFSGLRTDLRPLEIVQPAGASFEVDGHEIRWQKWRLRIGFNPREGLVLHNVGYEEGERVRPILYRASLTELLVPYGDPGVTHQRKAVFDAGENGLGMNVNSLELGCDCLGSIHYFNAVVNEPDGSPREISNAVCLHEEDYGVQWRHRSLRTGETEVRRSRRLVISTFMTLGNYDYGLFWYLYQDGTIQCEIKLTGIMSTGAVPPGEMPRFGTLCAPGLYAPNHQHIFNVRLDMAVDGDRNTVYEIDSEAVPPGEGNPLSNAWVTRATALRRESEAHRSIDPLKGRYWKVVNPHSQNALGEPVAYKLMPGENVGHFFGADAPALARAGFIDKHLWVTRYDPTERYASGDFPYQHPGGAGLPAYVAQDRSIEDTDVVVWYTFGSHHVPRPEDWPVTPVAYVGFHLKPLGFFDGNPALDLPPPEGHA